MKFLIVLVIALALAQSALGFSSFFERLIRNSKPSDNPVKEGYLGHDFYNAVTELDDADLFKNLVRAYSKYVFNLQNDLGKIVSGEVTVDTSKMSDDKAKLVNEQLENIKELSPKLNAAWKDNIKNKIPEIENISELPGLVLSSDLKKIAPGILKSAGKLIFNGVSFGKLVPGIHKSYTQELPSAIVKDFVKHPVKIALLIAKQLAQSRK